MGLKCLIAWIAHIICLVAWIIGDYLLNLQQIINSKQWNYGIEKNMCSVCYIVEYGWN